MGAANCAACVGAAGVGVMWAGGKNEREDAKSLMRDFSIWVTISILMFPRTGSLA